jgi:hypothetical protein
MFRFTIKSLFFTTVVVAGYALMVRGASIQKLWAMLIGMITFFGLVSFKLIRDIIREEKAHNERANQSCKVDVSNPTT